MLESNLTTASIADKTTGHNNATDAAADMGKDVSDDVYGWKVIRG